MTQPDAAQAFESYSKRFRRRALRRNLSDWLMFLAGAGLILWGILAGAAAMHYNWQWYRVPQFFFRRIDGELIAGPLVRGLGVTLEVTLAAAPLALGIGLVVALLRLSRSFSGRALSTVYLEAIRNTPLLVQMYLFYFVLSPILGIERFWTGVLCLAVFEASFISEIIRGGILSVRRGQWEAASALGLGKRVTYARVVLPQAVPLMLPPLTSSLVNLIKSSAIVSTIAIFDLTNEGRNLIADTIMTFEVWLTVAGIYLVLTASLSGLSRDLERRVRRSQRR
ncbi:MAG: amino acid ABC transporter permease [Rhodobacteraceae bacterium]|jgi:polar amino acid transport system permease protein|nr:amino acid ABC transporter permease [Paracoccaceae bacterium]